MNQEKKVTQLLRIEEYLRESGRIELVINRYDVKRETPKGYWIDCWARRKNEKFVLNTEQGNGKRFAYATLEEAMESYRARKRRQIKILSSQLKVAVLGQNMAEIIDGNGIPPNDQDSFTVPESEGSNYSQLKLKIQDAYAWSADNPSHRVFKDNL